MYLTKRWTHTRSYYHYFNAKLIKYIQELKKRDKMQKKIEINENSWMWCVIWSRFGCAAIRRRYPLPRRRRRRCTMPPAASPRRAALAAERLPSCVTLAICSNSFHTALQALFILRISISNDSFEAGQEDAMWRCPVHSNTMNWSYRLNSC